MASKRQEIVNQLKELFKTNLDGKSPYPSNVYNNVEAKQVFWDDVNDHPFICVYAGNEVREYLPGNQKWGFLTVTIRIYVDDEDSKELLEDFFVDIENLLDANNTLTVGGTDLCTDIRILSISDDEGVLSPLGVGEITLEIRYGINT